MAGVIGPGRGAYTRAGCIASSSDAQGAEDGKRTSLPALSARRPKGAVSLAQTLLPIHQTHDAAFRARYAEVALIGRNEYAVRSFERDCVIVSVEEMLLELRRKLCSALQYVRIGRHRQFEPCQHADVVYCRVRTFASKYCADFHNPVCGLQDRLLAVCYQLHQACCFGSSRFALRVLQQPFDDYAGIDNCNHDLPVLREARI